jgi:hypothetical protein
MTLADHLLAACGSVNDLAGCVTSMSDSIVKAERFVIEDDVAHAGYQVIRSRPASMLAGIPLCRVPFQRVWLEWNGGVSMRAGFNPPTEDKPTPLRMGCLLETIDKGGQRGIMSWAWEQRNTGVYVCGMSAIFDWSKEPTFNPDLDDDAINTVMRSNRDWSKHIDDPAQREAVRGLLRHEDITMSPHTARLLEIMTRRNPVATVEMIQSWGHDITGEAPYVTALIMMLNSRNAVELLPNDLSKLNKARKKRGKPPLLSSVTTRLQISARHAREQRAGTISREAARAHMVRGHFKIRKSGIYWWSPFKRGDPTHPVPRKEYVVT